MHLFEIVVGVGILAMLAFQAYVTVRVFRSGMYERKQKIWQAQIIWLLPIIGAGFVFSVLQEDDRAERGASSHLKG